MTLTAPPEPGTCHPDLAHVERSLRAWFEDPDRRDTVHYLEPVDLPASWEVPPPLTDTVFASHTLVRKVVRAPAPWTERPYVYTWDLLVEGDRHIAGEARIEHVPYEELLRQDRELANAVFAATFRRHAVRRARP